MNGANHKMDGASTFPFYIFGWEQDVPPLSDMPHKGDTIVGNDVWIGQNAVILPGVHIGDGAIIGVNSIVAQTKGDRQKGTYLMSSNGVKSPLLSPSAGLLAAEMVFILSEAKYEFLS